MVRDDGLIKLVVFIIFMSFYEYGRKKVKFLGYCIKIKNNKFLFNKFFLIYFILCFYYTEENF